MSDDPLTDPETDPREKYFDRQSFVAATAEVIRRAQQQSPSLVFGLIGPWGSGKSTIIASLRKVLAAHATHGSPWSVREFNPWIYSDSVSLQFGFFAELRNALPSGKKWADTRANLKKLHDVVSPIASAAKLLGVDAGALTDSVLDPKRIGALKTRDKIAEHLKALEQPILMVLDDLDRLTAGELLEVFKLVRFVGRLPNVHYLLCYDEKTLVDMLDKTDLVGAANDRRSLDYLEKIVQIRFDIPPIRADLIEELFYEAVQALLATNGIQPSDREATRMRLTYDSGFFERLTTPRSIKHLLAQIEAFLPSVAAEVDWVDFVLVSWIRTFEPGLYSVLQEEKPFLLNTKYIPVFDKKEVIELKAKHLAGLLERARVSNAARSSTLDVLQELFPAVKRAREEKGDDRSEAPKGRIAHHDYFDRFFQFGVPREDIADATVREAIRTMPDSGSDALRVVEEQLRVEPSRTVRKLREERTHDPQEALALANWLLAQYPTLPFMASMYSAADQMRYFLPHVLVDLEESAAIDLTNRALTLSMDTADLIADAAYHLKSLEVGSMHEVARWNARGELLNKIVAARFEEILMIHTKGQGVFELDVGAWRLWRWELLSPGAPRKYLRRRQKADGWSTLDILARFVTSAVPSGSTEKVGTIDSFDPAEVGKFVDLAAARVELATQISAAGELPGHHEAPATPENRRAYVLAWMKRHPVAQD